MYCFVILFLSGIPFLTMKIFYDVFLCSIVILHSRIHADMYLFKTKIFSVLLFFQKYDTIQTIIYTMDIFVLFLSDIGNRIAERSVLEWIIFVIFTFFLVVNITLKHFDYRIKLMEFRTILLFEKRTQLVPALYEITKNTLNKHDEIFAEILRLRKIEFGGYEQSFPQRIATEIRIHHELNFIFKVANANPRLQKNGRFLLIRDLFLENSHEIGQKMAIYKAIIKKMNRLISWKNCTIVGMLFRIEKRVIL